MPVDTVTRLLELLTLCIARGSLYALIAVGFALVFGAGRVLNLFHGSFFLLGAYGAHLVLPADVSKSSAWTRLLADAIVAGGVGLIALGYYYAVLRPSAASWLRLVTTGLAANLVVAEVFRAYYGTRSAYVPPIVAGTLPIGPVNVLAQEAVIVAVAAVLLAALGWTLTRSMWGAAVRAVAQDTIGARLVGINPALTLALTITLSGALAGLAGALAAPTRIVRPDMWSFALLKALTVVIVGGIGSLRGTCLAAYGLGAIEVLSTAWIGETAAEVGGVLIAVTVLTLRPRGVVADD
jgi:branched-chain amino acid transport system permease protein